jgi:hypothetical protein
MQLAMRFGCLRCVVDRSLRCRENLLSKASCASSVPPIASSSSSSSSLPAPSASRGPKKRRAIGDHTADDTNDDTPLSKRLRAQQVFGPAKVLGHAKMFGLLSHSMEPVWSCMVKFLNPYEYGGLIMVLLKRSNVNHRVVIRAWIRELIVKTAMSSITTVTLLDRPFSWPRGGEPSYHSDVVKEWRYASFFFPPPYSFVPSIIRFRGKLHRLDGPALELKDGTKWWYRNNERHRDDDDGPAFIGPNVQTWYKTNMRHRMGGPAEIYADASQLWYVNDKLHRVGGPAFESSGEKRWYQFDVVHREDGPAITNGHGEQWYVWGIRHREDGPAVIHSDGGQEFYRNGLLHRVDGPALIYANGRQEFYRNGSLHRVDGPARVGLGDFTEWYHHGQLHCETGPAVICTDGRVQYWLHGTLLASKEIWDTARLYLVSKKNTKSAY